MIREATQDDIDHIVSMCSEFHRQSPLQTLTFSPNQCRETVRSMIKNPRAIVLCDDHGLIAGIVTDTPFAVEKVAYEIIWFSSDAMSALKLLNAYERWVNDQNVPFSVMSSLCNDIIDSDRVVKLLVRRGYVVKEHSLFRSMRGY